MGIVAVSDAKHKRTKAIVIDLMTLNAIVIASPRFFFDCFKNSQFIAL